MIVVPLLRTLPIVAVLVGVGWLLDRLCRLTLGRAGLAEWPARAGLGLAAVFAVALDPLGLAVIAALALLARRGSGHPDADVVASKSAPTSFFVALTAATIVVAARPPSALYWDEFVWLAKASIESHGWGALRAAALDPASGVIPPGYPILWPLATAWLGSLQSGVGALLAGSAMLRLLAVALFSAVVIEADRAGAIGRPGHRNASSVVLLFLATTPIVLVHLRAAYVDLSVGLLAATCALALVCHREDPSHFGSMAAIAALSAFIVAGAKDEGFAHVVAITMVVAATAIVDHQRASRRVCAVTLASALLPFASWKLLTRMHQVFDADHLLGFPEIASIPALAFAAVRQASDLHSWGAFWPVGIAAIAAVFVRRRDVSRTTMTFAWIVIAQAGILALGVLCGPERVRVFALDGTLFNRLFIQIAPTTAVLVAMILRDTSAVVTLPRRVAVVALATLAITLGGCSQPTRVPVHAAAHDSQSGIVVVAPHPDDEALIAAGVIRQARVRGERVSVIVVTNGDYTCERNGWLRQRESVAAMALLGVPEADLHFLGYPDGHLSQLGTQPLPAVERRDANGNCVRADTTYGDRGENHADEHSARTGQPARYTSTSLTEDLAAVLSRIRPREIYVTHPIDRHPDHARTYAFLRRALERASLPHVSIHRAIVHAGPCWPNGRTMYEPCPRVQFAPDAPITALPDPLATYLARERVRVPAEMLAPDPSANLKYRAIATYASQVAPDAMTNWLTAFVRADEGFFPEELVADASRPGGLRRVRAMLDPGTAQRTAFHVRFAVQCTTPGAVARIRFASTSPAANPDGYLVTISSRSSRLALAHEQVSETAGSRLDLATFESAGDGDIHAYDLFIDPRPDDGGVTEVTVVRDREVLGVAVDPLPIGSSSGAIAIDADADCRVER